MPIYEYRCERGHTFEVLQRISDDPLTACEHCDAPVRRVFHPVAVHFKGSGFYSTDYGRKAAADGSSDAAGAGSKDGNASDSSGDGAKTDSGSGKSGSSGDSGPSDKKAKAGSGDSAG